MTKQEIFEKTLRIITENTACTAERIKPESKLMEEMEMTSLDLLILIGEIENAFDIRFAEEDLLNTVTMDDLTQAIIALMQP